MVKNAKTKLQQLEAYERDVSTMGCGTSEGRVLAAKSKRASACVSAVAEAFSSAICVIRLSSYHDTPLRKSQRTAMFLFSFYKQSASRNNNSLFMMLVFGLG